MQVQDAPAAYLFRLWPWIETNKNRIILGGATIAAAVLIIWFYSCQQEQKEITAGQELTQVMSSIQLGANPGQAADLYLKIATRHPGTLAGQRAQLQSAAMFFAAGRFADAEMQFQIFLSHYPDSIFSGQATLGIAASLDAQGKTNLAVAAYQRVINSRSANDTVNTAKFALARIDEQQGRLDAAINLYREIWNSNPRTALGSEAGARAEELKTKLPAGSSQIFPAAPTQPKS